MTSSPTRVSKRQQSLASFFAKIEKKPPASEVVVVDDSPPDTPSDEILPNSDREASSCEFDRPYPPHTHPSYHPPPSPTFNHPISISPIPTTLALRFNTAATAHVKPNSGLDLLCFKRFIDSICSWKLTNYLLDALPWYRVCYNVRGLDVNTPRFTTVFGKDLTDKSWTSYKCKPRAIPPILLQLMQKGLPHFPHIPDQPQLMDELVEEVTGETYNFTLVNYYASGSDSISYHSDSESFLGPNPCIASLSLGAPRDFLLRHVKYKELAIPVEKFTLASGDMVVMRGRTQHDWQHSVPKRKSAEGRINITFRKGTVAYATENYNTYNVGKGAMYRWEGGRMVEKG